MQEIQLDVSVNLAAFFLKNIGLWISDDPSYERRRKMILVYTMWCIMLSSIVISRDVYFTWFYNGDILYVVTNALSMMMITVKICMILMHKEEFINLIVYMQENFWNDNYDFHEREILENCKRTCAFFVSLVTTIGICAILSYLATPLIVQTVSNNSERMLPFNMWLKLPLSESPYYELMFVYQIMTFYFIGISYFCFDNIFCIMTVHLAGQFQILRYRFARLCDIKDQISAEKGTESMLFAHAQTFYERFKAYVRYHQTLIDYCEKIENVYTMIILGQVLVFSVLICLFGYQILLANAPSARRSIFIFLLIGAMSLLFMFTFSCNGVIEHSENIAIGAYSALWTVMPMNKFGKMLRNDLIIVIERSRRVCCLTANGFFPVSLETYTTILSTAVSYFTLLRNNVEKANEA